MKKSKLFFSFLLIMVVTLFAYGTAFSSTTTGQYQANKNQRDTRDAYELVIRNVSENPDLLYSGAFIDSSNVLNIGVKNFDDKTINQLRKLFKDNSSVKFFPTKHSYKELDNKIKELNLLNEKLNKKMGNNNPIVDFGISEKNNKIIITLKSNTEDNRKLILGAVGNEISIDYRQGDISLTASRTDTFRPLIGGIKVTNSSGATSTAGFGAIKPDGTKVLVVTGHGYGLGTSLYQPTYETTNIIGTVGANPITTRYSDAGYLNLNTVQGVTTKGEIYLYIQVLGSIASQYTPEGYTVNMHGIVSNVSVGTIQQKGVTVNHPVYGTLYNQIYANYGCSSSSPIKSRYLITACCLFSEKRPRGYVVSVNPSFFSSL